MGCGDGAAGISCCGFLSRPLCLSGISPVNGGNPASLPHSPSP